MWYVIQVISSVRRYTNNARCYNSFDRVSLHMRGIDGVALILINLFRGIMHVYMPIDEMISRTPASYLPD